MASSSRVRSGTQQKKADFIVRGLSENLKLNMLNILPIMKNIFPGVTYSKPRYTLNKDFSFTVFGPDIEKVKPMIGNLPPNAFGPNSSINFANMAVTENGQVRLDEGRRTVVLSLARQTDLNELMETMRLKGIKAQQAFWMTSQPKFQYGLVKLQLDSIEAAKSCIEKGILIDGLKLTCWAYKMQKYHEPCGKCQGLDGHKQEECKAHHPTCKRCTGAHWSIDCALTDKADFQCNNCKGTGHGTCFKGCPEYKAATRRLNNPSARDSITAVESKHVPAAPPQKNAWHRPRTAPEAAEDTPETENALQKIASETTMNAMRIGLATTFLTMFNTEKLIQRSEIEIKTFFDGMCKHEDVDQELIKTTMKLVLTSKLMAGKLKSIGCVEIAKPGASKRGLEEHPAVAGASGPSSSKQHTPLHQNRHVSSSQQPGLRRNSMAGAINNCDVTMASQDDKPPENSIPSAQDGK